MMMMILKKKEREFCGEEDEKGKGFKYTREELMVFQRKERVCVLGGGVVSTVHLSWDWVLMLILRRFLIVEMRLLLDLAVDEIRIYSVT